MANSLRRRRDAGSGNGAWVAGAGRQAGAEDGAGPVGGVLPYPLSRAADLERTRWRGAHHKGTPPAINQRLLPSISLSRPCERSTSISVVPLSSSEPIRS